jgi:hypothetical protein
MHLFLLRIRFFDVLVVNLQPPFIHDEIPYLSVAGIILLGFRQANRQANCSPPSCNTPQYRQCWGEYDINTNYHVVFPNTNITREVGDYICLLSLPSP